MVERAERRCPNCRALVGPDAEWCGQCFASLLEPQPEPTPVEPVETAPVGPLEAIAERPSSTSPNGDQPAEVDTLDAAAPREEPRWPCGVCGEGNEMAASVCAVCGSPFGRGFEPPQTEHEPVAPSRALGWSLVFPGVGHGLLGHALDGIARAIVFLWSVGSAAAFLSVRSKSPALTPLAMAFLLSAVAIYAVTALDARRLAEGRDQVLSSRALIWVSAGLVLFSIGSAGLILAQGLQSVRK